MVLARDSCFVTGDLDGTLGAAGVSHGLLAFRVT